MSTIYELPNRDVKTLTVGGAPLDDVLNWTALSVRVDNHSNQAVYVDDADTWIPGQTFGAILPVVTSRARASFQAPPHTLNPGAIPGQVAKVTFYEEQMPPSPGFPAGINVDAVPNFLEPSGGDDTVPLQSLLDTLKPVLLASPSGTPFKITGSIILRGFDLTALGLITIQPTVLALAHYPVFVSDPNHGIARFKVANLELDYSVLTGGVISANAADCGFQFNNAAAYPATARFENIYIRWANYGVYDTAGCYLNTWSNVQADHCANGFYKFGGTTTIFDNCYATNCTGNGFKLDGATTCSLRGCALQSCTGTNLAYFRLCHGLTIDGFDYEANTVNVAFGALFNFENILGFSCSGFKGNGNVFATQGANYATVLNFASGSIGEFSGCVFGADNGGDVATGAGDTYIFTSDGTANVIGFSTSSLKALTPGAGYTGTARLGLLTNTAGQALGAFNCKLSGLVTDPGGKMSVLSLGQLGIGIGNPTNPLQIFVPGIGQFYLDGTVNLHADHNATFGGDIQGNRIGAGVAPAHVLHASAGGVDMWLNTVSGMIETTFGVRSLGAAYWDSTGANGHTWRSNAGATALATLSAAGLFAASGGVGLDSVDHIHPHSATHHHVISDFPVGVIATNIGLSAAGVLVASAGPNAQMNTSDVAPGNTDNENVKHTHVG